jgi:hypothetical protein
VTCRGLGALDRLQRMLHPPVHLQNAEGFCTVAAPAIAAYGSAFCSHGVPIAHSRGLLSFLHPNYPRQPPPPPCLLLPPSQSRRRESGALTSGRHGLQERNRLVERRLRRARDEPPTRVTGADPAAGDLPSSLQQKPSPPSSRISSRAPRPPPRRQ